MPIRLGNREEEMDSRESGRKRNEELLPSFLHVVLYKFGGIFFQDFIDLID